MKFIISAIPNYGEIGSNVETLQNALIAKGFDPGKPDKRFGPKTKAAVSAAQKKAGLPGSGKIGPKTLIFLGVTVHAISEVTNKPTITQDFVGRGPSKSRVIHPVLRVMIEERLFPQGKVPECFKQRDLKQCVIAICTALASMAIVEKGGNNKGKTVGLIQAIIGSYIENGNGDAWCMSAVQVVIAFLEDYFQIESPVIASEGVTATLAAAKKVKDLVSAKAVAGAAACARNGTSWKGHTWIVLAVRANGVEDTFEGNTDSGGSRDGDGAYIRTRKPKKNGNLNTEGYVWFWPNGVLPAA